MAFNGTPLDPSDDFWVEEDKLARLEVDAGDYFGCSVSISDDRVVVGAMGTDDAGANSGSAYVLAEAGDCNRNGVADECDIRDGTSLDIGCKTPVRQADSS